MTDHARGRALSRLLRALGLARAAEVEHQRRVACQIRDAERARATREVRAAAGKLTTLQEKLSHAHQRVEAERAGRLAQQNKVQSLLETLRAARERLVVAETDRDTSLASERRLRTIYGAHEDRILLQLEIGVETARSTGVSPSAAARGSHLAGVCPDYAGAVARWQAGEVPADVRRVTIGGLRWAVPADSSEDASLSTRIVDGGWLPLDDLAIVRQFAVGGVMLDIGANIGTTSIPRAILGDFACVYAAEPNSDNYLCLVGNTLDNHLAGRVLPDRLAISSASGTARLRRSLKIGGHQLVRADAAFFDVAQGRQPAASEEVRCLTIEAWVDRLRIPVDEVRFVKIDTQGWDLHVLQGAPGLLQRRHIVWQIEVSPSLMKAAGSTVQDLCALVASHFTHVKELGGYTGGRWRPASETGAVLESLSEERRFANLLLFNLA